MKPFTWDISKNKVLLTERNVSFEEVTGEIENGRFLIFENLSGNHIGQKIFLVKINDYIHVVPFRENEDAILLITIFPSRFWQRKIGGKL